MVPKSEEGYIESALNSLAIAMVGWKHPTLRGKERDDKYRHYKVVIRQALQDAHEPEVMGEDTK